MEPCKHFVRNKRTGLCYSYEVSSQGRGMICMSFKRDSFLCPWNGISVKVNTIIIKDHRRLE